MTDETEVETVTRLQAVDVRDLYPDLAPEDASSRVCLLCAAKLKDKTHNLTRHLERHHAGALLQLLEQRNQASPTLLASKSKRVQQDKSAACKQPAEPSEVALLKADDAKLALARWLAKEQLPVDLVEKSGFREFVEALNDQFNPPQGEELRGLLGELVVDHDDSKRLDGDVEADVGSGDTELTVEMLALRATCRCSEDSPLVSLTRVACDIPQRGEAKVRVLRAAASMFDAQTCRGQVLGKNGVLGRAFVGVVVDVQPSIPRMSDGATATAMAAEHSIDVFDKVVASPYIAHVQQPGSEGSSDYSAVCLGVSSPRGALAEYVVLPVSNLCVVPTTVPDDLALLADDISVVLSIVHELAQRQCVNIAILSDSSSSCLTALLARYLHQECQATSLHVFSSSPSSRFQYASTTSLDIYQPSTVAKVLSKQSELAIDACIDLIGYEASVDLATSIVQSMGCVVLVDRNRLELRPNAPLPMDLNTVVVRELEVASVRDCQGRLHEAVEYLSRQAQDPEAAAQLRNYLLPDNVVLPQALEQLQAVAESEVKYLQVSCSH